MFDIIAQNNASENIQMTKSLTDIGTFSGTLKSASSIIDPEIIVKADLSDLVNCNYCTIDAFGRSYFVKDITSIKYGLVELRCHVDVISSFADEIKANTGIVKRQENNNVYNLYLNDGSLVAYQDPYILTEPFPGGFTGFGFILAVAGSASTS